MLTKIFMLYAVCWFVCWLIQLLCIGKCLKKLLHMYLLVSQSPGLNITKLRSLGYFFIFSRIGRGSDLAIVSTRYTNWCSNSKMFQSGNEKDFFHTDFHCIKSHLSTHVTQFNLFKLIRIVITNFKRIYRLQIIFSK